MDSEFTEIASALVARYREEERLLASYLSPSDQRIQTFLYDYLQDIPVAKLPNKTFVLDRPGLARLLSLPLDQDELPLPIIHSYRVKQGVLHNPKSDRRTTQGIFHVAEGGLPIPDDKQAVPKAVFGRLLSLAMTPPRELMILPLTAYHPQPAECFVSLLLRPVVCPEVPGFIAEKTHGDPVFRSGQPGQQPGFCGKHFWQRGRSVPAGERCGIGCGTLDRPHRLRHSRAASDKAYKEIPGPAPWDEATERQRRDGMCWKKRGRSCTTTAEPSKSPAAIERGVIVTVIADNYFGYCKKEVKTQISYSANLYGLCEEEHAGGALVFPSYDLGEDFSGNCTCAHGPFVRGGVVAVWRSHGRATGRLRGGPEVPGHHLCAGDVRFDLATATGYVAPRGRRQNDQTACRAARTSAHPVTRSTWRNRRPIGPGG